MGTTIVRIVGRLSVYPFIRPFAYIPEANCRPVERRSRRSSPAWRRSDKPQLSRVVSDLRARSARPIGQQISQYLAAMPRQICGNKSTRAPPRRSRVTVAWSTRGRINVTRTTRARARARAYARGNGTDCTALQTLVPAGYRMTTRAPSTDERPNHWITRYTVNSRSLRGVRRRLRRRAVYAVRMGRVTARLESILRRNIPGGEMYSLRCTPASRSCVGPTARSDQTRRDQRRASVDFVR